MNQALVIESMNQTLVMESLNQWGSQLRSLNNLICSISLLYRSSHLDQFRSLVNRERSVHRGKSASKSC